MTKTKNHLPLITEILEIYMYTPEGIPLWKAKGVDITYDNLLENIFILSSDIASYFKIRHDHLCSQNIAKLQKKKYLSEHLPNFREMFKIGNAAQASRNVYSLTRQQTEHLIMDFAGTRAFQKKHDILNRLQ